MRALLVVVLMGCGPMPAPEADAGQPERVCETLRKTPKSYVVECRPAP